RFSRDWSSDVCSSDLGSAALGDKGPMDRQAEAATGGVVVWVDFVSRVASYAPLERESRMDWMALAHDAEARAQTARTKRQRDLLIRCALEYRAKARSV